MARNAQREQNEYQKMYNLSEVDTQALMKMDNEKLYKGKLALAYGFLGRS